MPNPTVEIKLEDFLVSIQKDLKEIRDDLTDLKIDMATVKTELNTVKEDVKDLKGRATAQILALTGLITTLITAIVATAVKLGFFSNP